MIIQKRRIFFFLIFGLISVLCFLFFDEISAIKKYNYDLISVNIQVNSDSTIDIEERQIFNYQGKFNQGWRSIPFKKVNFISSIEVIDGDTKAPLIFSPKKLNKLNPSSWGKFTYYKKGNEQVIEWYYNLADEKYEWIIKYKVHGGIGFYKEHDEFYWNLLTDYEAPISRVEAYVKLPENSFSAEDFQIQLYSNISGGVSRMTDNRNFYFNLENVSSRQPVTIFISWPKGLILQSAWWKDFFKIYLGYILSFLIIFLTILICFLYWYFTEKYRTGRGTIIPKYEPPKNLKPAMIEVIYREKITEKAWPATIVDLAVRGYLKIKEDSSSWSDIIVRAIGALIIIISLCLFLFVLNTIILPTLSILASLFIFFLLIILILSITKGGWRDYFLPKNYVIEKIVNSDNSLLDNYEKEFLKILFDHKGYFSTKELKRSPSSRQALYKTMKKLKEKLYEEVEDNTGAFEKKLSKKIKLKNILIVVVIIGFYLLYFRLIPYYIFSSQSMVLIWSTLAGILILYLFIKYEARLSREGQFLKEDCLGFKIYLEVAERYRMENLTPEIFEKYLSYAMIFGIEKKWAKAFEVLNINVPIPLWYSYSGGISSSGSINFSPSAFSSSFVSSFTSAFSSTGGGGGAGGGAGGGGGGGGGGAS